LATTAVVASSLLNHEVSRRLAAVPLVGTTTTAVAPLSPTTTLAAAPSSAPRPGRGHTIAPPTTLASATAGPPPTDAPAPQTSSEIITSLDKLTVADEHSDAGRNGRFGYWRDDDHDGCNTGNEVLIDESTEPVNRTPSCRIISGRWVSPYDGAVLTSPSDVSIDHVVTLAEAWESGAWQWTDQQRNDYLNDLQHPDFLVAVSNAIKDDKGDKDPGQWLPPVESDRCDYLRAWVHLKTVYQLTVDPGEREAIAAAALHC
jgi:hypothetical protein